MILKDILIFLDRTEAEKCQLVCKFWNYLVPQFCLTQTYVFDELRLVESAPLRMKGFVSRKRQFLESVTLVSNPL
jgi:hypothetical protein